MAHPPEAAMTETMTHFPTPIAPLPAVIESPSAQAAAGRRGEAERKRIERAKAKAAGLPDPRVIDTALIAALIETLEKGDARRRIRAKGTTRNFLVGLHPLLSDALANLKARGIERDVAAEALRKRLRLV